MDKALSINLTELLEFTNKLESPISQKQVYDYAISNRS